MRDSTCVETNIETKCVGYSSMYCLISFLKSFNQKLFHVDVKVFLWFVFVLNSDGMFLDDLNGFVFPS